MSELTIKQQKFADEYIITGNATQAYKKAYPNVTKDTTANANSSRLLRNAKVSAYIAERTESIQDEKKMDLAEAIVLSSSIARGEIQKGYSKQFDRLNNEVIKEIEYEHTPTIEERQKSLEHIIKINGGFLDRKEISATVQPIFLDDITGEGDG